jgi:hypothetical protein
MGMPRFIDNLQDKVKSTSNTFALLMVRILTGLFVGLTISLIGQEIIAYGWLSFTLVICVVAGCLLKISKYWSWTHLLIFNLICVLIGLLLRMYILIAPGS